MIPRDDRDRRPPAPDAPFAGSTESASGADREETATHMFDLPEQAVESLAERVPSLDDRIEAHDVRLSRLEECIADLQETLQRRIWAAESAGKSAAAAAEVRLAARIDGLAERQERAEPILEAAERRAAAAETGARKTRMEHATYHDAWNAAPLTARIRFVRELLAETHTLQPVLKEVAALEDLRRRGAELETWLTNYPSLFADAVQAIDAGQAQRSEAHEPANPVEALAGRTVSDARIALDAALQALGVTWVDPAPGDAVTSEHEVVADEPADAPAGSVAQLRRRGFRIRGRLVVPAQVERAIAKPAAEAAAKAAREGPAVESEGAYRTYGTYKTTRTY
ncbi:MAG TPA: hypothetical protein VKT77_15245, partial [Chthonomonadaceae bacterium]|nr:hypothetical protein [Chthonomonadaceae bacterium]